MKPHRVACAVLITWLAVSAASAAELPADYYKLMAALLWQRVLSLVFRIASIARLYSAWQAVRHPRAIEGLAITACKSSG